LSICCCHVHCSFWLLPHSNSSICVCVTYFALYTILMCCFLLYALYIHRRCVNESYVDAACCSMCCCCCCLVPAPCLLCCCLIINVCLRTLTVLTRLAFLFGGFFTVCLRSICFCCFRFVYVLLLFLKLHVLTACIDCVSISRC